MQKIQLPTSTNKVMLSFIQEECLKRIFAHNDNGSYGKHLAELFDFLTSTLSEGATIVSGEYEVYINLNLKEKIERTCQILGQIVYNYSQGTISTAYRNFINDVNCLLDGYNIRKFVISENEAFYRMRPNEDHLYSRKELFHIPFEKRGIIKGNNRYSIAGFPCLYIGTSIFGCWTEIGPNNINQVSVACLKSSKKYELADMRFYQQISSNAELEAYIKILPIVAACSFRALDRNSHYIPEYIIPQMLLHTVVKTPQNNSTWINGIAYNPIVKYDNCRIDYKILNTSLVLPVTKIRDIGLCEDLCEAFPISHPLCVPINMTKEKINEQLSKITEYKDTIFGKLESKISKYEVKQLAIK